MRDNRQLDFPLPIGLDDEELAEFRRRLNAMRASEVQPARLDTPPALPEGDPGYVTRRSFGISTRSIVSAGVFVLMLVITIIFLLNQARGRENSLEFELPPDGESVSVPTGQPVSLPPIEFDAPAVIISTFGSVSLRDVDGLPPREPRRGEALVAGMHIETGANGYAVFAMKDGTAIVLETESVLGVNSLTSTDGQPAINLQVVSGNVFVFQYPGRGPTNAVVELQSAGSLTRVNGASASVFIPLFWSQGEANPGNAIINCLMGGCYVESTLGDRAQMQPGSRVEVLASGAIGDIVALTPADIDRARNAFVVAQNSGLLAEYVFEVATLPETPEPTSTSEAGSEETPTDQLATAAGGQPIRPTALPTPTTGPFCGDNVCNVPGENSLTCSTDCLCVNDGVCRASQGEGPNCADCAPPPPPKLDRPPVRQIVPTSKPQPTPTRTPRPTNTPKPTLTNTPKPTLTPVPPTATPVTPTATPTTPTPTPTDTPTDPPTTEPPPETTEPPTTEPPETTEPPPETTEPPTEPPTDPPGEGGEAIP